MGTWRGLHPWIHGGIRPFIPQVFHGWMYCASVLGVGRLGGEAGKSRTRCRRLLEEHSGKKQTLEGCPCPGPPIPFQAGCLAGGYVVSGSGSRGSAHESKVSARGHACGPSHSRVGSWRGADVHASRRRWRLPQSDTAAVSEARIAASRSLAGRVRLGGRWGNKALCGPMFRPRGRVSAGGGAGRQSTNAAAVAGVHRVVSSALAACARGASLPFTHKHTHQDALRRTHRPSHAAGTQLQP